MERELKDGRHENFIPTTRAVTVSMSLAEYELERKRRFNDGYKEGLLKGQRNIIFTLNSIQNKEYGPEVVQQNGLPDQEWALLGKLAEHLYGTQV